VQYFANLVPERELRIIAGGRQESTVPESPLISFILRYQRPIRVVTLPELVT
jgi:hypothetical protein